MKKYISLLIMTFFLMIGKSYAATYITLLNDDHYPFSVYPGCVSSYSGMPAGINIINWKITTPKTQLMENVSFPPGAHAIWSNLKFEYIPSFPAPGPIYTAIVPAASMALSSSFTFFSGSTTLGVWLYRDASGNYSFKFGAP